MRDSLRLAVLGGFALLMFGTPAAIAGTPLLSADTTLVNSPMQLISLTQTTQALLCTLTCTYYSSATTNNWAGYAVVGPVNSVTDVKGSWSVPAVQGPCPSYREASAVWIGIDGFNDKTVEQIGTGSDCNSGAPSYYAWYEFYPKPMFVISSMAVKPGDVVSAEVRFSGGKFVISMTDVTTGKSFSYTSSASASRTSAEWIVEAPSSGTGTLPLVNFGTAYLGSDYTAVKATGYATVSGVSGTIGSFGSTDYQITMTGNGGVKAGASSLTNDGTSFSVNWVSSGP